MTCLAACATTTAAALRCTAPTLRHLLACPCQITWRHAYSTFDANWFRVGFLSLRARTHAMFVFAELHRNDCARVAPAPPRAGTCQSACTSRGHPAPAPRPVRQRLGCALTSRHARGTDQSGPSPAWDPACGRAAPAQLGEAPAGPAAPVQRARRATRGTQRCERPVQDNRASATRKRRYWCT